MCEVLGGIVRGTVGAWKTRHVGFPDPAFTVGKRPAWALEDILAWAERTGRGTMIDWSAVETIRRRSETDGLANRIIRDTATG